MADDIKILIGADATPVERAVRILDNLEAELRKVERAEKAGLITKERAKAETDRLTASMQKLKVMANASISDFNKFEKSLYNSGKSVRQNELAFQQAGYQLQDFIVQVQAGTSPVVAFSQQFSQLAGFFAGPWGAGIGLGIAVLGGLTTALLGTKGKAEDVYEEFNKLFDYLNTNKETTKDLISVSLSGPLEKARLDAIEVLKIFRKIDEEQARQKLNKGAFGIVSQISDIQDALREERNRKEWNKGRFSFVHGNLAERQKMFDPLIAEAANLNKAFADALKGPVDGLAMRLNESFLALQKAGLVTPQLEKDFRALMEETGLMAQLTKDISAESDNQKKAAEDRAKREAEALESAKRAAEEERKRQEFIDAQLLSLSQKILLEEAAQKYGKTSTEYRELQNKLALQQYEAELRRNEVGEKQIAILVAQKAHLLDMEATTNRIASTILNFAPTPAVAAALAKYGGRGTISNKDPIFGDTGKSIYSKTGGGGKSPAQKLEEYLKAAEAEVALKIKQVGLTEAQARAIELETKFLEAKVPVDQERINNLVKEEEALLKLTEAEEKRKSLSDSISAHIENAFVAMVDGSKSVEDAFKGMIRNILIEIYREKVVKSFLDFFFAKGGVFKNGNVTAFAGGGVVGSPTYFPMAGGKTGLMGEAGPEAIMPLKRGPNGKLGVVAEGGSGAVNIVQHFNFSANGDESVKRIIKQQLPDITNATKAAVADSKRRGGAYGRAFN